MTDRFRRGTALAALLLVVPAGLSACSDSDGGSGSPDSAARGLRALAAAGASQREVARIERQLTTRCMRSKGFQIAPPTPKPTGPPPAAKVSISPTSDEAARTGYGLDPGLVDHQDGTKAPDSPWSRLPDAEKSRYTDAMMGPATELVEVEVDGASISMGTKGCLADVRRQLYGDLKTYLRLQEVATNQVRLSSRGEADLDPGLADTMRGWSACLAKSGYPDVPAPADARSMVAARYKRDGQTQAGLTRTRRWEKQVATADADCATSSGLRAAYEQARAAADSKVLTRYENDLVAWQELTATALQAARRALEQR
ncbi:MAG: hypothetical protein QOH84_296 [Kribbellaceae bacterium]|jgi:hypothetical protein|nr:hypothetical protein [Kribbellaceae bacterium]